MEEFGEEACLLTQDTYLAVEAGMQVPKGLEMGVFSYYPGLNKLQAERLNLSNREHLMHLIQYGACPVAAFSALKVQRCTKLTLP